VAGEVPVAESGHWWGFSELARRHGDYAIVGLAAWARRSASGLQNPRIVLFGIGATPVRAHKTEALLNGQVPAAARMDQAVSCLRDEIEPFADLTNSAETKRHLAGVLLQRVLATAQP
jgi:carbon-monoxide dehydrogenase medium subunit